MSTSFFQKEIICYDSSQQPCSDRIYPLCVVATTLVETCWVTIEVTICVTTALCVVAGFVNAYTEYNTHTLSAQRKLYLLSDCLL